MYEISKRAVVHAYKQVKANKGAAGIDEQSLTDFEKNLKDNLYKIWNRMTSGSYMAPAVREVEIPKSDGKPRKLGIPTVADRIAQTVAKMALEPILEKHFHADSYGYRPGKSAHDAIDRTRKRCWDFDWVIDLDIKGFFDNLDHELMMKAVAFHTDCKWLLLYIKRWLKAPIERADGQQQERTKGTPQGGVVSPLLANLFLHYAFDKWMDRKYPKNPFARYADDIIVHCKTRKEAERLKDAIEKRLRECKLELHPEKTHIVYCKDDDRNGNYPNMKFDFLSYTFRARGAKRKTGEMFIGFLPAISDKAKRTIRQKMRNWKLHLRSGSCLEDIAKEINPILRGWINYYGKFYKSELNRLFTTLNSRLGRWAKRKYKRLRSSISKSMTWIESIATKQPALFAHWKFGIRTTSRQ